MALRVRRNATMWRGDPWLRWARWVPTTRKGAAAAGELDVDHDRTPSGRVGGELAQIDRLRARDRQSGTAPRSTTCPAWPGEEGGVAFRGARRTPIGAGRGAVPCELAGPRAVGPTPASDAIGGAHDPPPGERQLHRLVSQSARDVLRHGLATVGEPAFLEHEDIGVDAPTGVDHVEGPTPPVHATVHVVAGDDHVRHCDGEATDPSLATGRPGRPTVSPGPTLPAVGHEPPCPETPGSPTRSVTRLNHRREVPIAIGMTLFPSALRSDRPTAMGASVRPFVGVGRGLRSGVNGLRIGFGNTVTRLLTLTRRRSLSTPALCVVSAPVEAHQKRPEPQLKWTDPEHAPDGDFAAAAIVNAELDTTAVPGRGRVLGRGVGLRALLRRVRVLGRPGHVGGRRAAALDPASFVARHARRAPGMPLLRATSLAPFRRRAHGPLRRVHVGGGRTPSARWQPPPPRPSTTSPDPGPRRRARSPT